MWVGPSPRGHLRSTVVESERSRANNCMFVSYSYVIVDRAESRDPALAAPLSSPLVARCENAALVGHECRRWSCDDRMSSSLAIVRNWRVWHYRRIIVRVEKVKSIDIFIRRSWMRVLRILQFCEFKFVFQKSRNFHAFSRIFANFREFLNLIRKIRNVMNITLICISFIVQQPGITLISHHHYHCHSMLSYNLISSAIRPTIVQ